MSDEMRRDEVRQYEEAQQHETKVRRNTAHHQPQARDHTAAKSNSSKQARDTANHRSGSNMRAIFTVTPNTYEHR
jgi:hypothetical protein